MSDSAHEAAAETLSAGPPMPDSLRGDGPCSNCGTLDNIIWFTDSVFWNAVVRIEPRLTDDAEILCITCFVLMADQRGYRCHWRLSPEWPWQTKAEANDYPVQALPKAELVDLLALYPETDAGAALPVRRDGEGDPAAAPSSPTEQLRCPECRHAGGIYKSATFTNRWQCEHCGTYWRNLGEEAFTLTFDTPPPSPSSPVLDRDAVAKIVYRAINRALCNAGNPGWTLHEETNKAADELCAVLDGWTCATRSTARSLRAMGERP